MENEIFETIDDYTSLTDEDNELVDRIIDLPKQSVTLKSDNATVNQYHKLKDFLSQKGFKLINDIDFWNDTFEIAFENLPYTYYTNSKSTVKVKEYFEEFKFNVEVVEYRNCKFDNNLSPTFKLKKLLTPGKDFFIVRLSSFSPFFDDYSNENMYCDTLEENVTTTFTQKDCTQKRTNFSKRINKKNIIIALFLITFLILSVLFVSAIFERRPSLENDIPEEVFRYDKEILSKNLYNLIFETRNGIREFYNAEYFYTPFSVTVKSYKNGEIQPYRIDIFSRFGITNITQIDNNSVCEKTITNED